MDLRKYIKENQLVHVEFLDKNGEAQRYPSRVENIWEDRVALASPVKDRIPLFIPSGNYVSVYFTDRLSVYSFRSKVIVSLPERLPLLILEAPDAIEKAQKREYVRVAVNLNVYLRYTDTENNIQEVECKSRDLSGGGMMLVLDEPLKVNKGHKIKLMFQVGEDLLEVYGEIIRTYKEYDAGGIKRQIAAVKFLDLAERHQQSIIKFVYQRQIELRRKGLL